jgi:hypothetical protein
LLALFLIACPVVHAQEPEEAEGSSSSGRPLDGYMATGILAGAALFVIAKSARR